MKRCFSLTLATVLLAAASMQLQAAPIGPVYPAPGGNDWVSNGVSAFDGTAVWSYSNFNLAGIDELYFGLNQVDYGLAGAGLNGSADPFSLTSAVGSTAIWEAATLWDNPGVAGTGLTPATTRLTMTVSGGLSWTTDLASIGLDDIGTYGPLGAVVDNSAGADFDLTWMVEANTGSGWQAINLVQQPSYTNEATRSSIATGFYYVETPDPGVPLPATPLLLGLGLVALGVSRRRKD